MRIIINIEVKEEENRSSIRKTMNESLENVAFDAIKSNVENTFQNIKFTSDYFKNCEVIRES